MAKKACGYTFDTVSRRFGKLGHTCHKKLNHKGPHECCFCGEFEPGNKESE